MAAVGKPLAMPLGGGGFAKRCNNGAAVIVSHHQQSPPAPVKAEPGLQKDRGTVLVNPPTDFSKCKRKISFAYTAGLGHQPASVARRNARERNRVKQVNNGFATLRQHIPVSVAAALSTTPPAGRGASKKLSKVETLRMAVEYIRSLKELLDDGQTSGQANSPYYCKSENVLKPDSSLSPPCSEASSSPPPSSYASEGSYNAPTSIVYHQDNYEPMSPEDEELLDVISWWQQSQ